MIEHVVGRVEDEPTVVVLAGTGGNGGGPLVCARHLHALRTTVRVALTRPHREYTGVAAHQLGILERLGIDTTFGPPQPDATSPPGASLIVDGVVGYSLDVPSGLDSTDGVPTGPVVHADATMVLALPKSGFAVPGADAFTGNRYLADIGVPPEVYYELGVVLPRHPTFAAGPVIALDRRQPDGGIARSVPYHQCAEEHNRG